MTLIASYITKFGILKASETNPACKECQIDCNYEFI
jgi:hypothetical protein